MAIDMATFVKDLDIKLNKLFDRQAAIEMCDDLVKRLLESIEPIPLDQAERVLYFFQRKRMFEEMEKLGGALIQTGRATYKIRRQYAQSLIDSSKFGVALKILQDIVSDTSALPTDRKAVFENAEAKGLIGRLYKQLYVNEKNPSDPKVAQYLNLSIKWYHEVYSADNSYLWHGINTVALLERARRDEVDVSLKIDARQLATEILNSVQTLHDDGNASPWNFATAAEACVALGKPEEALDWLSGYARMPICDAFELSSTLRQLKEVWQLELTDPMGQHLLPLLTSELLQRKGTTVTLTFEELKTQKDVEPIVDKTYNSLVNEAVEISEDNKELKLEKVFAKDSMVAYETYKQGGDRCRAIARIGKIPTQGLGTGFLLRGKDLQESLGNELVLLTNYHVVSDSAGSAMRPYQAKAIFEALDGGKKVFQDLKLHWSSPVDQLDATVLRFSEADQKILEELVKGVELYPLSEDLPQVASPPTEKVFIIGHPGGNTLTLSLFDNVLLYHDKVSKLHYRASTDFGSSGSPVFNDQWSLIALHHGAVSNRRIPDSNETYDANEGIWIQAIRKKIAETPRL